MRHLQRMRMARMREEMCSASAAAEIDGSPFSAASANVYVSPHEAV